MSTDPVRREPRGATSVRERFVPLKAPSLVSPDQAPEVAAILQSLDPQPVGARGGARSQRIRPARHRALLLRPDRPAPGPREARTLSLMSRALGAWFVVRRGQTLEAGGRAAHGALPEIERVMRLVRELLRAAAREPQKAALHLDKAARTLDSIALLTSGLAMSESSTKPDEAS